MNAVYSVRGVQDLLEVFEDRLTITPKGALGFLNKGLKGTKEIPFSSITAVQLKEASLLVNGYFQITLPGGNESRGGVFGAASDENSFFFTKKDNETIRAIKNHIDSANRRSRSSSSTASSSNVADELQKLASLRQQGILSEDEFQAAKKRILA